MMICNACEKEIDKKSPLYATIVAKRLRQKHPEIKMHFHQMCYFKTMEHLVGKNPAHDAWKE